MRRFLNFKKEQANHGQVSPPSLPNDVSFDEVIHMTKRGFVAKKIATYLEMDPAETDKVYFRSLSQMDGTLDTGEPYSELIYFSEGLLDCHYRGERVEKWVDKLSTENQVKNAILKVYDIYRKQLNEGTDENNQPAEKVDEKWKVYRDVMYSATQGKFVLICEEELESYKSGVVLVERDIKVMEDIPKSRDAAKIALENLNYNKSAMMSMLLVISEAITNTLKHAEQGNMLLVQDHEKSEIKVVVSDNGCGFDLESLPKKTLMAGYSTKKSLGQGFQLMLKMSEQVLLHTTDKGSTIILKFADRKNGEMSLGTD